MKRNYNYEALNGKAMTLDELRTVLQDTADVLSVDGSIKVRITFGGGIKSITITEDRG